MRKYSAIISHEDSSFYPVFGTFSLDLSSLSDICCSMLRFANHREMKGGGKREEEDYSIWRAWEGRLD